MVGVHNERLGCAGISLVVVQGVQVPVAVEHPVRSAVVHKTVSGSGNLTAFQRFGSQQYGDRTARNGGCGSYHIVTLRFGTGTGAQFIGICTRRQSHSGHRYSEEAG